MGSGGTPSQEGQATGSLGLPRPPRSRWPCGSQPKFDCCLASGLIGRLNAMRLFLVTTNLMALASARTP